MRVATQRCRLVITPGVGHSMTLETRLRYAGFSVRGRRLMPLQFLVGCSVSVINIMIHALITLVAIGIARRAGLQRTSRARLHLMTVMVVTALVLMIAHTAEIIVWSLAYAAVGAAPAGSDLLDFAFVNYTTLGYGDVTPSKEWRLVGPMTAMNGILMFGWSTAVLFEVLRKTVEHLALIAASDASFSSADPD
jgi:hypothetical protein